MTMTKSDKFALSVPIASALVTIIIWWHLYGRNR